MKKTDVILGAKYYAKVSGNLVEVRIDAVGRHGGWTATNLATHKTIHIKSAQRLRSTAEEAKKRSQGVADAFRKSREVALKAPATATDECPRGGKHDWTTEDGERFCSKCIESAPKPAKNPAKAPAKKTATATKETKTSATKPATPATASADAKPLSAINAAAKVLAESGEPMNAKEMIDAMTAKGYWTSPGGKTPHSTLYSAIIREISVKASASRFTKTERGKFTFNADAVSNANA